MKITHAIAVIAVVLLTSVAARAAGTVAMVPSAPPADAGSSGLHRGAVQYPDFYLLSEADTAALAKRLAGSTGGTGGVHSLGRTQPGALSCLEYEEEWQKACFQVNANGTIECRADASEPSYCQPYCEAAQPPNLYSYGYVEQIVANNCGAAYTQPAYPNGNVPVGYTVYAVNNFAGEGGGYVDPCTVIVNPWAWWAPGASTGSLPFDFLYWYSVYDTGTDPPPASPDWLFMENFPFVPCTVQWMEFPYGPA